MASNGMDLQGAEGTLQWQILKKNAYFKVSGFNI